MKNRKNKTPKKEVSKDKIVHRILKLVGYTAVVLLVLAAASYAAFKLSPWPGALLIRYEFNKGGKETEEKLQKHVPDGVAAILNQSYRADDNDALLDVYYPENTTGALPTVVWIHGGAWVSGSKDSVANYSKIIASNGYTVVAVNYSIAPEKQYPTPVIQSNAALKYLNDNAERLHVNPESVILAGDSAGSQIAAQLATIVTNPTYASEMAMSPAVDSQHLKAVVLNCGAYDLSLADQTGPFAGFLNTVLWAYSGTKEFRTDPKMKTASVINYVSKEFPPTFITAGNADPLLPHSEALAAKLTSIGSLPDTLFYEKNHTPELNHEYQFDLDTPAGQNALQRILEFLAAHS